jgi:hypothetical protein
MPLAPAPDIRFCMLALSFTLHLEIPHSLTHDSTIAIWNRQLLRDGLQLELGTRFALTRPQPYRCWRGSVLIGCDHEKCPEEGEYVLSINNS